MVSDDPIANVITERNHLLSLILSFIILALSRIVCIFWFILFEIIITSTDIYHYIAVMLPPLMIVINEFFSVNGIDTTRVIVVTIFTLFGLIASIVKHITKSKYDCKNMIVKIRMLK